jgi:predicted nucleic acid-binding protein
MACSSRSRVFFDTNVLFSGVYSESGTPKQLLDAAGLGQFQAVVSRTVLEELVRNLRKKAPGALPRLEKVFRRVSFDIVSDPPREEVERWSSADFGSDSRVVAAAVLAEVDYFCTGDRRLLEKASLMERAGLRVVAPGDLLETLE